MRPLVHCAHTDSTSWHSHMSELALALEHSELLLLRSGILCRSLPGSPPSLESFKRALKTHFFSTQSSHLRITSASDSISARSVRALIDFARDKCIYYYYYYYGGATSQVVACHNSRMFHRRRSPPAPATLPSAHDPAWHGDDWDRKSSFFQDAGSWGRCSSCAAWVSYK